MNIKVWLGFLILVFGVNFPGWAASTPQTFTYSGKLANPDGTPMPDGMYDVLFGLYANSSGGTPIWQELHRKSDGNGVLVNKGNFQVTLGNQVPLPQFDRSYYIGVSNALTRQELIPREPLASVPYALAIAPNVDLPIGTITAWHKSMTHTPQDLPYKWVECNGQTLHDPGSPYDGQVIPNLNGATGGNAAPSPDVGFPAQMFLRGGQVSGIGQEDTLQNHEHAGNFVGWGAPYNYVGPAGSFSHSDSTSGISSGRVSDETRPINMSVVWIMKIK